MVCKNYNYCSSLFSTEYLNLSLQNEHRICSDINHTKGAYIKNMIDKNLDAWHKFVPPQSEMTSRNCWYNIRKFTLSSKDLTLVMKNLQSFVSVQQLVQKDRIRMLIKNLFERRNLPKFSKHPTHYYFCLPTIFLVGFAKSGTSLLYQHIAFHPLFAKPYAKEIHFWREVVKTNETYYKQFEVLLYLFHFASASKNLIKKNPKMFSIDASASTVFDYSQPLVMGEKDNCVVPLTLFEALPRSKIIIIMRNPIDRLWSDYWYYCSRSEWKSGKKYVIPEHIPPIASELFHNYTVSAIDDFIKCVRSGQTQFYCATLEGSRPGKKSVCKYVRLGLSIYYLHVVKWFSVFPRSQILLIRTEDLSAHPSTTMNQVWSFIDVYESSHQIKEKINRNAWIDDSKYSKYFKMWPETRKILWEFFKPYNLRLAKLLNDERFKWTEQQ